MAEQAPIQSVALDKKYKHMYSHFPEEYEYSLSIAKTKVKIWEGAHDVVATKGGTVEDAIKQLVSNQSTENGVLVIGDPPCHQIDLKKAVNTEWSQEVIDEMKLFLNMGLNEQDDIVTALAMIRKDTTGIVKSVSSTACLNSNKTRGDNA